MCGEGSGGGGSCRRVLKRDVDVSGRATRDGEARSASHPGITPLSAAALAVVTSSLSTFRPCIAAHRRRRHRSRYWTTGCQSCGPREMESSRGSPTFCRVEQMSDTADRCSFSVQCRPGALSSQGRMTPETLGSRQLWGRLLDRSIGVRAPMTSGRQTLVDFYTE